MTNSSQVQVEVREVQVPKWSSSGSVSVFLRLRSSVTRQSFQFLCCILAWDFRLRLSVFVLHSDSVSSLSFRINLGRASMQQRSRGRILHGTIRAEATGVREYKTCSMSPSQLQMVPCSDKSAKHAACHLPNWSPTLVLLTLDPA